MKLRRQPPTRKQKFNAALDLAGMTLDQWCAEHNVTRQHLAFGFRGERTMGAALNKAIDDFIAEHLTNAA